MIEYNKTELDKAAKGIGFVRDTFEKVLRLKEILKFINTDELLKTYLALKGGTAINMTIFDLPRLSVDIDMDFTPNLSLENMRGKRSKITERIKEYMAGEGYQLSPHPRRSHSLDSFLFIYHNAVGNKDNFKIEIDYSLRAHIFSPVHRTICADIFNGQMEVQTLAPMEIFAAKVNALMNRAAARDLYDVNNMVSKSLFAKTEYGMLRKCIIFYASVSAKVINKSFDTSAIERLTFLKIKKELFPVLRSPEAKAHFDLKGEKDQAERFIRELMILTQEEKDYLDLFEKKEYRPELLFDDKAILDNIKNHPMILWKMCH